MAKCAWRCVIGTVPLLLLMGWVAIIFGTSMAEATASSKSKSYQAPGKLIASLVVSRHGDRSPQMNAPAYAAGDRRTFLNKFPIDTSKWPVDYGQLTPLGMKQAYHLGSFLRSRYVEGASNNRILDDRYDHVETHARSTDVDRTIVTAMAILNGLYPHGTGPKDGVPGRLELIPVHTVTYKLDALLDGSASAHCPKFKKHGQTAINEPFMTNVLQENEPLIRALPALTGVSVAQVDTMEPGDLIKLITAVRDVRVCQRAHDVSQPSNVTRFDKAVEEVTNAFMIAKWNNTGLGYLVGGRLLRGISRRLSVVRELDMGADYVVERLHLECNEKGNDSDESGYCPRRFVLMVGHDTTILDLRAALGMDITVEGIVPYMSHLVFELRQDGRNYNVQVLSGDCTRPTTPEGGAFCPARNSSCRLDEFMAFVEHTVPKDIDTACKVMRDGTGDFIPFGQAPPQSQPAANSKLTLLSWVQLVGVGALNAVIGVGAALTVYILLNRRARADGYAPIA
ncbi:Prostatic acid phosphatase [Porphyridium purpureum]|uniref:Prostatic acid phosphatase n=1 Tax=Porphyridium purpureum TaxID=35688 RepID=A0A5J4YTA2_PORPP|nr:Prostatic acid phosphatase [Porphyridium purpureum]|eukprot:POR3151..scf227_4